MRLRDRRALTRGQGTTGVRIYYTTVNPQPTLACTPLGSSVSEIDLEQEVLTVCALI
jgi:hypothetical protein